MTTNVQRLNTSTIVLSGSAAPQARMSLMRMVAALFGARRVVLNKREDLHDFSKPQNQKHYLSFHQTLWR